MQIEVSQPRSRDLRTWRVPIGWGPSQLPRARLKAASDIHNERHLILFGQYVIFSLGVHARLLTTFRDVPCALSLFICSIFAGRNPQSMQLAYIVSVSTGAHLDVRGAAEFRDRLKIRSKKETVRGDLVAGACCSDPITDKQSRVWRGAVLVENNEEGQSKAGEQDSGGEDVR